MDDIASDSAVVRPIRILYLIDTLESGGAERSLLEISSRLDRNEFDPVVVSLYEGEALQSEFEAAGVRVKCLNNRGTYRFVEGAKRVRESVRLEQPDLIHTSLFRAGQVGRIVGWLQNCPVISTLSGTPYARERIQNDSGVSVWKLRLLQLTDACTARCASHFHSVSETVKTYNCRHLWLPKKRVVVVPRGRDVAALSSVSEVEIQKTRTELRLGGRYPVVLNVGRLMPAKNQENLIRSIQRVRERYPDVLLLIAGDGPLRSELEQQITESGLGRHVSLLGNRSDVPSLLQTADVFAFPSVYEGLPGALIEAMLASCAIVASDIPMITELIQHDIHGITVSPNRVDQIAAGICRLAEDESVRQELGRAARESASRRFDIVRVVREMQDLYRQVLTQRRAKYNKQRTKS